MATKALPQAKVNTTKFLPSSKKTPANLAKQEKEGGALLVVETKLIKVENLIKTNLKIEADSTKKKQRRQQLQQREVSEDELEEQPEGEEKKAGKKISLPRLSFLERIKSFLFKMILTFVTIKLLPHLGKIAKIIPSVIGFVEGVLDWSGKLFDAMAGFVAGAYELRDKTAGFMKQLGGDLLLGTFQAFEGAISKVIEASIIIMMASGGDGGLLDVGGEMLGNWLMKKAGAKAATSAATQLSIPGLGGAGAGGGTAAGTAGAAGGMSAAAVAGVVAGAGLLASALGEGAFQLRKVADKPIKETQKKYDKASWLDPRKYFHGAVLAGQRMLFAPIAALGFILDIVGAPFRYAIELLRMPFLDEKGKKKQAKNLAKLDSRIREDFRKGLNMLTLGFAFKEKGQFGNIYGDKGAQKEMMSKMASGGTAGKGEITRKLKRKPKTTTNIMPTKIDPGRSITDKSKFDKMFPNTTNYHQHLKPGEKAWWDPLGVFTGGAKEESKKRAEGGKPMDPIGYLEDAYKSTSEAPFFGPLMGATIKLVTGDKPSKMDYRNVGQGLNAWVYSTFGDVVKEYAQGGEVTDMFMDGQDLTMVIAKSVEKDTKGSIGDVITELQKQLALQPLGGESKAAKTKAEEMRSSMKDSPTGSPMGSFTVGGSYEKKLAKLLASYEGLRTAAYPDPAHGWSIPTIGIGATFYPPGFRLSGKVKKGDTITEEEAYWIKQQHIKSHRARLFKEITPGEYAKLPDGVKAALESKVFNYGSLGSTLTGLVKEAVKSGNYSQVSAYFRNTLAAHNGGINSWRRNDEAGLIGDGKSARAKINFGTVPTPLSELSVEKEPMRLSHSGLEGSVDEQGGGGGDPGKPKKIYLHWTAGGYQNVIGPYHTVFTGDGKMHRQYPYDKLQGHTESRNSGAVGLSVAAMSGGEGNYAWPTSKQLDSLTSESARLAKAWGWAASDINLSNVLTHGEAGSNVDGIIKHTNYGPFGRGRKDTLAEQEAGSAGRVADMERWDLDKLEPGHKYGQGGNALRNMIKSKMWTGGYTKSTKHVSWLGERGKEFVMDADSTAAMDSVFPGLLSALNKADYDDTIGVLRNYAQYELGAQMSADVPDEMIKPFAIPMPGQQTIVPIPVSMGGSDPFQTLDNGH